MSKTNPDAILESAKKTFVKSLDDKDLQKSSDKLFQKFKENTLIQRATNPDQSLQNFSDFLGIPCDELQDKLGDERLNSYVSAFAQTMEEFNEQTEENPPPHEDTKTNRNSARQEIMEGLKRRVLGLVKLKLPSNNFPKSFEDAKETYTNTQGYKVTLKQKDGYSLYEKSIDENYLETLSEQLNLSGTKKNKFIELFTKHRDSIDNFDEMFFFHYHQKASSIKATYKEIARELKIGKSEDEIKNINTHLQTMISHVDTARNEALREIQEKCKEQFNKCLKKSIKSDGTIDIKRLNKLLNKSIKMMKKESDVIFKQKLHNNQYHLLSSLKRNSTNAFGGETCMKSTSGGVTTTIQSTPITAHAKGMGPAMSKITMEKDGAVVHQSYRTSHLVSDVEESPETVKERIAELVKMLSTNKTVIYSLYTSVYNRSARLNLMNSALLFKDEPTNHQTQRLEILLKAQDDYNQSIRNASGEIDYSKLFFTFNTPTNGYGEEISLKVNDPLIQKAAKSNIVAMAVMLFGTEVQDVKNLIDAYLKNDDQQFMSQYEQLKAKESKTDWTNAKKNLHMRFINDDAAKHQHAKTTATCEGILSDGLEFTLIEGCKSGLERTGNILGRVESYHKDKANEATQENMEEQEQEQIKIFTQKLHSDYNENGLYGASSCLTSLCDQGGNPKTSKTADPSMLYMGLGVIAASLAISLFFPPAAFGVILGLGLCIYNLGIRFDTNKAEDRNILTHYESSKMSELQAHKDKNFDGLDQSDIELMKKKIEEQLTGGEYKRFVPSDKSKFVQLKSLFRAQQQLSSPEEHAASSLLERKLSGP